MIKETMKLALDEFENQKAGLEEVGITDHNINKLITTLRQSINQLEKEDKWKDFDSNIHSRWLED